MESPVNPEVLQRRLERERKARKQAEQVAEEKTLELFRANQGLEEAVQKATGELRDTLAHLSSIINNLADGLLVTDNNGIITNYNPTLSRMFGLEGDGLKGKSCADVFLNDIPNTVRKALSAHDDVFSIEVELAGGRIGNAAVTAISQTEDNENSLNGQGALGTVMLIRDITREKEVDQMKTDFISMVSHELRTPLTSVLGFTKIIKKRLNETIFPVIETDDKKINRSIQQVDENIDIIIAEGQRLTALINDVLDIAKMEAGRIDWHMESLSIEDLLERAYAATAALFSTRDNVELVIDVEPDLPHIVGDEDRLLQVLINLISNANKFTDEGVVTCTASRVGNSLVVSISDTGSGISERDLPLVFDKFKQVGDTLTDKPAGTGLGLPICKQIVEHHGGEIWVESTIGAGSTFSFRLGFPDVVEPRMTDFGELVRQLKTQVGTSPTTQPTDSAMVSIRKEILVVDDEAHIRELLRQELEAEGYAVREAYDGVDAMARVKEKPPDLIILDVMMPNISGFDVVAMLKTDPATMDVPIIILSIVEDRDKGFRLGVDRYLTKPLNTDLLFTEIEGLLEHGVSKKKVIIMDEDTSMATMLLEILNDRGYHVTAVSDSKDLLATAREMKPDMILANGTSAKEQVLVQELRFEKGLENVYIFLYQ